ncbi:class I SAM-dependent methyltransferase [Rhizomonospora bruguierae]|uniref:class I SAM-dependent methyltransferase n=1 Tax=Rhizomonospora bruguierae TaxID=1581705 RepID=UPI001BD1405D|nr:class I SAM-dependent methyltransferase [Micromonospora sp. NBRC 107566]
MGADFRPNGTHDWHSATYVSEWIEGDATRDVDRRPMLRRLAGLIPATHARPIRVLDVGGGYGAVSAEVLERWPAAHVTLHDYSQAMVSVAAERLGRYGTRVTYRLADMNERGWADRLGGPFDAVVSALAIHNVAGPELVERVYHDIFGVLRPGGALLNMDLLFPASDGLAELYRRDPTRHYNWDVRVTPADVDSHLRWLRRAGFSEVDCVWKDLELGLLWASRAA